MCYVVDTLPSLTVVQSQMCYIVCVSSPCHYYWLVKAHRGGLFPCTSNANGVAVQVVNTRLYNQKGEKYKGMTDCFVKTIASEGPTGLYKGFSAHFMRVAPHTILTFVFLEALQRNVEARRCAAMPSHPE
jgi:hypothetical protein